MLLGHRVIQVACGSRDAQTLALTDEGKITFPVEQARITPHDIVDDIIYLNYSVIYISICSLRYPACVFFFRIGVFLG